jgi:hypothetical protein
MEVEMADEQPTPHEGDAGRPRSPLPPLSAPFKALVLHGPWVLILSGVGMMLFGFFADRPDTVLIAALAFGTGMVTIGVLAPRITGETSVSPTGITVPMGEISQGLLAIATARKAAETMAAELPGDPEAKERRVNEVVGEVLTAAASGWTRGPLPGRDVGQSSVSLVCPVCGDQRRYARLPKADDSGWFCSNGHQPVRRKRL